MEIDVEKLPDDPTVLKTLIVEQQDQFSEQQDQFDQKKMDYIVLEEKFLTLQSRIFGKSSEKWTPEEQDQRYLFNEAEDGNEKPALEEDPNESETTTIKEYTRKKRGRKPLPENLKREEFIYDLPDDEKQCDCCNKDLPKIGEEVTEELDIIPAQVKVNRHIRLKYGPCDCDDSQRRDKQEIKTAPMPPRMIPGSIVSPGLLAFILVSKFADALPFYRQERIFKRIDAHISRQTMCNWATKAALRCADLLDLMWNEIRSGPVIGMDETSLQVLHEPGRSATAKSWMWVAKGFSDGKPLIIFHYHTGRDKSIPTDLLKDYKGFLQTDGLASYNEAGDLPDITHAGCFVHARRLFFAASKLTKKKTGAAHVGLSHIQKLYRIENTLRDDVESETISQEEFILKRKEKVEVALESFHKWLNEKKDQITPESKLGEAIWYTLGQWHKLKNYTGHYLLTPDNNTVENAIRPFVIGRKNWLFSNTPRGAHASATIYSIIETAKANDLEPYRYLRYLFTKLPAADTDEELRKLLPTRLVSADLLDV